MDRYLSVDIGGTSTQIAMISLEGGLENPMASIEESRTIKTGDYTQPDKLLSDITKILHELRTDDVRGVGISTGGFVDNERGLILDWTRCRFLENYPIRDELTKALNLPVSVRNDTECFAMGEWAFGAGRGSSCRSFFGVMLGTGLGGCLLLDGKPYKGAHGYAGEIGEFEVDGRLLENLSSGGALREISGTDGDKLHELAGKGESKALEAFSQYGARVGAVIHSVVAAYDPEIIVLGGSVSSSFGFFSESMNQHLSKVFTEPVWRNIVVKPSELDNAGLLGAVIPLTGKY
jgi:glucokinase